MNVSISSSSPLPSTTETALQKESKLFRELFVRLINAFLNRSVDLRPEKAVRRTRYLIILLLLTRFLVSLSIFPLAMWAKYIQDIFSYVLNADFRATYVGNPFTNFLSFAIYVITDPRIFQFLPIFLAPFFIALQCAR